MYGNLAGQDQKKWSVSLLQQAPGPDDDLPAFFRVLRAISEGTSNFAQTTKQASVTFRTSLPALRNKQRFTAGTWPEANFTSNTTSATSATELPWRARGSSLFLPASTR
jgi:hypothetical protein